MEKLKLAIIIMLFGTIGVISTYIPLSSAAIVFYRGIIASIFLFIFTIFSKDKLNFAHIKKNVLLISLVGVFLSVNWILQFESFRIASVSVGTVCYNTMPIFVIMFAPIMFKEKLLTKHIFCVLLAMAGVILVTNLISNGLKAQETLGCLYAIIAAICYALVVVLNKKLESVSAYEKIIPQFFIAALFTIPYIIINEKESFLFHNGISEKEFFIGLTLIILLSVVHTGIAYAIYFDLVTKVDATSIAILTYLDPVVALCLSFLVLRESLNIMQIIGAILILVATIINEFVSIKGTYSK